MAKKKAAPKKTGRVPKKPVISVPVRGKAGEKRLPVGMRANPHGATDLQFRFAMELLRDPTCNLAQAAIRAGGSPDGASRLAAEPAVRAIIEEEREYIRAAFRIEREQIAQELAKIGFSNILDYVNITESGNPELDLNKIHKDLGAAITELNMDKVVRLTEDGTETTYKTKFKLGEKRAALMDLAKIMGHVTPDRDSPPPVQVTNNWIIQPVQPVRMENGRTIDHE